MLEKDIGTQGLFMAVTVRNYWFFLSFLGLKCYFTVSLIWYILIVSEILSSFLVALRRPEVRQLRRVSEIIYQAGEPRLLFLYEQKLTENPYIICLHTLAIFISLIRKRRFQSSKAQNSTHAHHKKLSSFGSYGIGIWLKLN
jgi:hypothetical protein